MLVGSLVPKYRTHFHPYVQVLSMPGKENEVAAQGSDLAGIVHEFQKLSQCNVLWQGDLTGS